MYKTRYMVTRRFADTDMFLNVETFEWHQDPSKATHFCFRSTAQAIIRDSMEEGLVDLEDGYFVSSFTVTYTRI